jgi:RNA polymerase sigma factor (sigma-70 family)
MSPPVLDGHVPHFSDRRGNQPITANACASVASIAKVFSRSQMTKRVEAQLCHNAAWLRRLALTLVGDMSLADDLVQQVWLTALRAPPRLEGTARPWLAKVARNLVRSEMRSLRSHDRWQRLSADADELPSPEVLIARQEGLRILGRLVSELEEPYRSTVLLCYGEELTPTQVARRLGLAPGTVRWRLKYALDRLRAQLPTDGHDDRRAGVLVFLGVRRSKAPGAPAQAIRAHLAVRVGLMAASATLLGLMAVLTARSGSLTSPPAATSIASQRQHPPALAPRFRIRPRFTAQAGGIPAWVAQSGVAARRVAGRVLEGGAPATGARVVLGHQLARYGALAPPETVSDRDGRFDFGPQLATTYTVMAQAPGSAIAAIRIDLREPGPRVAPGALQLTVRPCSNSLQGRVLDRSGLPIVGARVLASGLLGASTGADGSYHLCVEAGKLDTRVEASGYGTILVKADVVGRLRRDVVLVPHASVSGEVLRGDGGPVESAHVRAWRADPGPRERFIGPVSTLTDAQGRFHLEGLEPGRWRFAADGGTAAVGPSVERALSAGWSPNPVTLSVGRAVRVAGRVIERGQPVVGATISLISRTGRLSSDTARTQEGGEFVIDRVHPGELGPVVRGYLVVQPSWIDPSTQQPLDISVERPVSH